MTRLKFYFGCRYFQFIKLLNEDDKSDFKTFYFVISEVDSHKFEMTTYKKESMIEKRDLFIKEGRNSFKQCSLRLRAKIYYFWQNSMTLER